MKCYAITVCSMQACVYLSTQWAAVSTHWLLMRVPPQLCFPTSEWILTCQGQLPEGAPSPPTIRLFRGACPQSDGEVECVVNVQLLKFSD